MELQKLPHACVRLDVPGGTVVIDPGVLSGADTTDGADVVLLTHSHEDHLDTGAVTALAKAKPDLRVYGPASLAGQLDGTRFTAVRDGDVLDVLGARVSVHGTTHAPVLPGLPPDDNVGYTVDGLYHPGDAFALPAGPVHTLLAPVSGPWLKLSEVTAFIEAVAPTTVVPIHDADLNDIGLTLTDSVLSGAVTAAYRRMSTGERLVVP